MNTHKNLLRDHTYIYWIGGSVLAFVIFISIIVRGFSYFQEVNNKMDQLQSSVSALSMESNNAKPRKIEPSADVASLSTLINGLIQKITALDRRFAQVEQSLSDSIRGQQPVGAQSDTPVAFSAPPLLKGSRQRINPERMKDWMEEAPRESKQQVEMILQKHAQAARERIAAETDMAHPDRNILRQIMEESQANIHADLQAELSPHEYEALFDEGASPFVRKGRLELNPE